MALPTKSDLQTMDWSFRGQPFVRVPAKADIKTDTLDWSFRGQPYWCIKTALSMGGAVRILPSYGKVGLGC